ncbi:MAG: hypothetical protein ACREHE_13815 [Rhizomicrobium sp.]
MKSAFAIVAGFALAVVLAFGPAAARNWKSTPQDLAQDYSQILDNRGKGELVMIWWISSPVMPQYPDAQKVLDRYVIIGVVHANVTPGGTMEFDPDSTVTVKDGAGTTLTELPVNSQPPVVAGMLTTLEGVLRGALGSMGQGIHWLVFEGGNTSACTKGELSVQYSGETYTYQTPIPGCPAG